MNITVLEYQDKFVIKTDYQDLEIQKVTDDFVTFEKFRDTSLEDILKCIIPKKYIINFDQSTGKIVP